jgi:hypothetical protein
MPVHKSFVIFPKAAYVSSLASFNRKVVLFLATKPLTCAHINSIGLSSEEHVVKIEKEYCKENCIDRSVIEPIIIDFCDDDPDDDAG